jgi:glycosyltransferase involved in cell wall biosynthesis
MGKPKLIRITTVPLSLEKLLEGQLAFMSDHYEVVAVSSDKYRLQKYGKEEGVSVFPLEITRKITPLKDLLALYKLFKFLRKEKPLIVHTHTPKAGIVGMLAAYLAKVPLRLHTVAGLPLTESRGMKKRVLICVEKLTYRIAHKIYPNSRGLHDYILSEGFTDPKKIKIIGNGSSNGIDSIYFNPNLYSPESNSNFKKNLNIPDSDFVYIFIGRLVKDKGVTELVQAFEILNESKEEYSLLLVGPYEHDLDPLDPKTIEIIDFHEKIFAVGYQQDVRPFLACSDALIFPSYREGFPNVVLQANAMGLPAVVTNINGCNEIISEGENGILIPMKNMKAVYEAMNEIGSNKTLYKKLANNTRTEIVKKYDRTEICEALLLEYRELEAKL